METSGRVISSILFVCGASLAWYIVNGGEIAREHGFDPFRYEFFARHGLPDELRGWGHNIVLLLSALYLFAPYYVGFIGLCVAMHAILATVVSRRVILFALFSPITFYYIGQTGKDGLSILSCIAVAAMAVGRPNALRLITCVLVIGFALYVRSALCAVLPVVFVLFRYGVRPAATLAVGLGLVFWFAGAATEVSEFMYLVVVETLGEDLNAERRQITFGYSAAAIGARLALYVFSVLYQPFLGFLKYSSAGDLFLLYEAVVCSMFLAITVAKRVLVSFIMSSIPFVILVSMLFPFYHFRYLAILYPVAFVHALMQRDARKRMSRHAGRGIDVKAQTKAEVV